MAIGKPLGGEVTVTTSASGTFTADEVLVATGRRPRLDDAGLEAVGLAADDVRTGHLPPWLHVVGDASGEPPLTHWGKYRARVVGDAIAAAATGHLDDLAPSTMRMVRVDGRRLCLVRTADGVKEARNRRVDIVIKPVVEGNEQSAWAPPPYLGS